MDHLPIIDDSFAGVFLSLVCQSCMLEYSSNSLHEEASNFFLLRAHRGSQGVTKKMSLMGFFFVNAIFLPNFQCVEFY